MKYSKLTRYKVFASVLEVLARNEEGAFREIKENFDRQYEKAIGDLYVEIERQLEQAKDYDTYNFLVVYKKKLEKIM